jgi:hypothetical protein
VTRHKQGDELAFGSQTYAALHQSLAANRRDGSFTTDAFSTRADQCPLLQVISTGRRNTLS